MSVAISQAYEKKNTKILVRNCALHSSSDAVFGSCAHAHTSASGIFTLGKESTVVQAVLVNGSVSF